MDKCIVCDKKFKPKNGSYWQRFCSVAHRSKWHYWDRSGQLNKKGERIQKGAKRGKP